MIKTAFHLKDPKSTKSTTIFVLVSTPTGRIKAYLPFSIEPCHWDSEKKQFKKSYDQQKVANPVLEGLSAKLKSYYHIKVLAGSPPTTQEVREFVDSVFGKAKEEPKAITFNEAYNTFIDSYKSSRSTSTVAKHRRNLELAQSFVTNPNKAPLKRKRPKKDELPSPPMGAIYKDVPFGNVTAEFVDKWVIYLLNQANFTNNTAAKAVRLLNTFLNWATIRGFNIQQKYKDFKNPGLTKETDVIALTEEELMKLYFLDLKATPYLARVRDVFCFGAFTGQRFSDISGLRAEHIKGTFWHLRVQKTKESNIIPLTEFPLAILAKYENSKLPAISNQKTNEYLKELGKLAEINDPVTLYRYKGSEKIDISAPKHKFIGTHTARRTFATLALEKGMRPETVMRVGGWKDYRSFKKYIRLTDKVVAAEMNAIKWDSSKFVNPMMP